MLKINPKAEVAAVKGWATAHLVLAAVIALAIGIVLGAIIF